MTTFILLIFTGGDPATKVEFTSQARCEAARAAIASAFKNYLGPRTVCVPK